MIEKSEFYFFNSESGGFIYSTCQDCSLSISYSKFQCERDYLSIRDRSDNYAIDS